MRSSEGVGNGPGNTAGKGGRRRRPKLPRLKPPQHLKFIHIPDRSDGRGIREFLLGYLTTDVDDWDSGDPGGAGEGLPGISKPKAGVTVTGPDRDGKKGGKEPAGEAKFICPMCGSPFTEDDSHCPNCGKFFD